MAKFNSAQFETLWESAKAHPGFRMAETKPIQVDMSLSAILTQYVTTMAKYRDNGKISQADYDALAAAVAALKAILVRIKESELLADLKSQNAAAIEQQVRDKIAKITGSIHL